MAMISILLTIVAALTVVKQTDEARQIRIVAASAPVGDAPILGRATCGNSVWLLNQTSELVEVSVSNRRVVRRPIRGFQSTARPWGLACVADGTLWTLETPRSLVHLASDGRVVERIDLWLPRVALFASGNRLLFQQLPAVVAAPLLATSVPRKPFEVRTWAGLLARTATSRADQLAQNIVNCGIASGVSVPCWFANEARVTVSDGTTARSWPLPFLKSPSVDQTLPIWDAALVASGHIWILATSARAFDGRRVGRQLIRMEAAGTRHGGIDLDPPARLILTATQTTCTVLTARGELMEVIVK